MSPEIISEAVSARMWRTFEGSPVVVLRSPSHWEELATELGWRAAVVIKPTENAPWVANETDPEFIHEHIEAWKTLLEGMEPFPDVHPPVGLTIVEFIVEGEGEEKNVLMIPYGNLVAPFLA